jgi:hypothetical protein
MSLSLRALVSPSWMSWDGLLDSARPESLATPEEWSEP